MSQTPALTFHNNEVNLGGQQLAVRLDFVSLLISQIDFSHSQESYTADYSA